MNVTARDKGTGKEQTIQIESSGGLDKDEIERMQRDAEAHAAEDKKRRELAEARNTRRAAGLPAREADRGEQGQAERIGSSRPLRAAIEKVNEAKKHDDAAAINGRSTSSSGPARRWPSIFMASAKPGPGRRRRTSAGRGRGRTPAARPGGKPEDVIDVEFEEKK